MASEPAWRAFVPEWDDLDSRVRQNALQIQPADVEIMSAGYAFVHDKKKRYKVYSHATGRQAGHLGCGGCKGGFDESKPCKHILAYLLKLGLVSPTAFTLPDGSSIAKNGDAFYRELQKLGPHMWRCLAQVLHHVALLIGDQAPAGRANIAVKAYAAAVWRHTRRNMINAVHVLHDPPHRNILREVMQFEWSERPIRSPKTGLLHNPPPFSEATLSSWFAEPDVEEFLQKALMVSGVLVREFENSGSADGTGLERHTKSDYADHIDRIRQQGYGVLSDTAIDAEEEFLRQAAALDAQGIDTGAISEIATPGDEPKKTLRGKRRRDYEKVIPFILTYTRICPMVIPSIKHAEARYSIPILMRVHAYLHLHHVCFDMGYVKQLLSWLAARLGIFCHVRQKKSELWAGKAGSATPDQARRTELQFLREQPELDRQLHGKRQASESYNASLKRFLGPKLKLRVRTSDKRIQGKKALENEQLITYLVLNAYYLTRFQAALSAHRQAGATAHYEMWSYDCQPLYDKAAAEVVTPDWIPMRELLERFAGEPKLVEEAIRAIPPRVRNIDWTQHFQNGSVNAPSV